MSLGRLVSNGIALAGLAGLGYWMYAIHDAESRVITLCARIAPGMSFSELSAFARKNGLAPNPAGENVVHLVEKNRPFAHSGCVVTLESGHVRTAAYRYDDD
jgi:hypothetical protein